MCGIFGYIGTRPALPILIGGLERLEYRGYDSAGVVILESNGFFFEKCAGKIAALRDRVTRRPSPGGVLGIGHTRWATHGEPTADNAHPHFSCDHRIALVHNGIVENHAALREELQARGHTFRSQTDTEVIVHLIEEAHRGKDPAAAVSQALRRVRGSYALGIVFADHPDLLIGARYFSPLIVGVNHTEHFIASDIPAILPHTNDFRLVEDGQIVALRRDRVDVFSFDLKPQQVRTHRVTHDLVQAQKHGFPHFMLKEIHEAPEVVRREFAGRLEGRFDELALTDRQLASAKRIVIAACGTAWHAGLYAKYVLEEFAGLPVDCWLASELRYSPPPMDRNTLFLAVSQSGETADTLQALRMARERRARTIAVTNTPASSLAREADGVIYNRAGIEIGVAATKTYLAQVTSLLILAAKLSGQRRLLKALPPIPDQIQEILKDPSSIRQCADRFKERFDFMYIGRRYNVATAYEGALKMKEISYRHAEGYAAGEMKHGPLALVDPNLVTVAIAPKSDIYEKLLSNVEEIRARKGRIVAVVTRGDSEISEKADFTFEIAETPEVLSPLPAVVPLQLLAYYTATLLGRDVDKPRNLAKSVTVE